MSLSDTDQNELTAVVCHLAANRVERGIPGQASTRATFTRPAICRRFHWWARGNEPQEVAVFHWRCALCGVRTNHLESSPCPQNKASVLRNHQWVNAFDLAHDDGVLVWQYDNREDFEDARSAIQWAGWTVESVAEVALPISARRVAFLGPFAWLRRRKRFEATLRRNDELLLSAIRDVSTSDLEPASMTVSGVDLTTLDGSQPVAYCLNCKTRRRIENPETLLMKNQRTGSKGLCAACGRPLVSLAS